jgi:hypothetical protein
MAPDATPYDIVESLRDSGLANEVELQQILSYLSA